MRPEEIFSRDPRAREVVDAHFWRLTDGREP